MNDRPTLWHIEISHYNEKVRWALDFKSVEHERRTPVPGLHIPLVLALTRGRGYTVPLLELDSERIADSTRAIAALERRYPEPPLYPADPDELRRALDLEEFFDEEVAPYVRRAAFHEMRRDPEEFREAVAKLSPPSPLTRFRRLSAQFARGLTAARYGAASERRAAAARERVVSGFDRLERELGDGDYLVGGRFTVADLSAAALLYPVVLPPEGPVPLELMPAGWRRFRAELEDRRGFVWVQEMFARHRHPGAAAEPAAKAVAG
jgi:glutathione S-transferase